MTDFPIVLYNAGLLNYIIQRELLPLETGFVLIADSASQARQFVNGYCTAEGFNGVPLDRWNMMVNKPENYEVGMLILAKKHTQSEIEKFLAERDFFPVVISTGILPDYLKTDYPIFAINQDDIDLVRSTAFSEQIKEYRKFAVSNVRDVCSTLRKVKTSLSFENYDGSAESRPLYEYLMAVGSVMEECIWNHSDEKTALEFFNQYRVEYLERISMMDEFDDDEEVASRLVPAIWKYIEEHEDVSVCAVNKLCDNGIKSSASESTILWDEKYYYMVESLFKRICESLEPVSMPNFMRQLANAKIIEKPSSSDSYTNKKKVHFFDKDDRPRYLWLRRDALFSEENLALEDLYDSRAAQSDGDIGAHDETGQSGEEGSRNGSCVQIGTVKGKPVCISAESLNHHILITGRSGAGKSTRIEMIEKNIVANGGMIIEFDINGTHSTLQDDICNHISVNDDGMDIKLFDISDGTENRVFRADNICSILSSGIKFGANQSAALRNAVLSAMNDTSDIPDLKKISNALEEQDGDEGKGVRNKLWTLFEGDLFHESDRSIRPNMLNILSFQGLTSEVQSIAIEIVMAAIWRELRLGQRNSDELTIVLDEFQNLKISERLTISQMLKEGRKYNVNLILATQSLAGFDQEQMAALNQASVHLFFQQGDQSDLRSAANTIDPSNPDRWKAKLNELKRGEAVSVGTLCIGNNDPMNRPIITRCQMPDQAVM